MLLVMIDRYLKWTELVPLRSATAESLNKAFGERIIARYGVPKVVITDNGVQFASQKFLKSFLAEMGIRKQFTAPYTNQENPSERGNRTVKTMIAQFAGKDQRNWDEKWPEIMLAVNTSTSDPPAIHRRFLPRAEYRTGTGRDTEPRRKTGAS